jgi:hypothetical protein
MFPSLCICALASSLAQSPLKAEANGEGVWILQGEQKVLFYQRQPKARDGNFTRSNYIHPLHDLDGEVLTEDFPADHPHHRGVFWAWHQLLVNGKSVGDPWALKDAEWRVVEWKTARGASTLELHTSVDWISPLWTDAEGKRKPIVHEKAIIRVHRAEKETRFIDFVIRLRAAEGKVQIGGAEDRTRGYGGFSPRLRLPTDVRFLGHKGEVEPQPGMVEPSPWMDVTASYGPKGPSGVAILVHPRTPGYPQPWILRRAKSMQNAVYPGATPVALSTDSPLTLAYRLVIHRGSATIAQLADWHQVYAKTKLE